MQQNTQIQNTVRKNRSLAILFMALGVAVVLGSNYLRNQTLSHMNRAMRAHAHSVSALVKKSVSQGAWSTATIYTLYEDHLLTTLHLLSAVDISTPAAQIQLNEEEVEVFVPNLNNPTQNALYGRIPTARRAQLVDTMREASPFELIESGVPRELALICMTYFTEQRTSMLCHDDHTFSRLKKDSGIGPLLDELVSAHLAYVALQDPQGILAAAPRGIQISKWNDDPSLAEVLTRKGHLQRELHIQNVLHFEELVAFRMVDDSKVVLRVAVNAALAENIRDRTQQRHFVVITLVVIIEGLLMLLLVALTRWKRKHLEIESALADREQEKQHWELIGGLSATVAHEIRNPLNTISMTAQRLKYEFTIAEEERADFDRLLQMLTVESSQLNKIVTDFLELGKPSTLAFEDISLATFIGQVVFAHRMRAQNEQKHLRTDIPEHLIVSIDVRRFTQVLSNLILNALDATDADGVIHITAVAKTDRVCIDISDDGIGMTESQLAQATDPFVSFKANGTGLGLALVLRVVQLHQGTFTLSNHSPRGLTAAICIPRQRRTSP